MADSAPAFTSRSSTELVLKSLPISSLCRPMKIWFESLTDIRYLNDILYIQPFLDITL